MKSLAVIASLFVSSALCYDVVELGESKRALASSDDRFAGLPEVDIEQLASFGAELDEFELNQAMKCMGNSIHSRIKARLLDDNKAIMSKSSTELVDRAMGYQLNELSRSLLFFSPKLWKTDFDRYVHAARLYGKEWCPLGEWRDQEGLDWRWANYHAVFKADNLQLLHDMFLRPVDVFQAGEQFENWMEHKEEAIRFIREHLPRLIIQYDSARILEGLYGPGLTFLANLLSPNLSRDGIDVIINATLCEGRSRYIIGESDWKLRTLLKIPWFFNNPGPTSRDHIEYAIEHKEYLEDGIIFRRLFENILRPEFDWALEILHRERLLGDQLTLDTVEESLIKKRTKILAWISDRSGKSLSELFPSEKIKKLRSELVNKGIIGDFVKQAVYEREPDWTITDDQIRSAAADDGCSPDFVKYALEKRTDRTRIRDACSVELIEYNAKVGGDSGPTDYEWGTVLRRDDIGLAIWSSRQEQFEGLLDQKIESFTKKKNKSFRLVKWLWEERKIEPSEEDIKYLIETEDLEAYTWVWSKFQDVFRQIAEENPIKLAKGDVIQWWIENVDPKYVPDMDAVLERCTLKGETDSVRWLAKNASFNIELSKMIMEIYEKRMRFCSPDFRLDFLEMLYMTNTTLPTSLEISPINLLDLRKRRNFKIILAGHGELDPIPVDECEFIASLPNVYEIDSSVIKKLIAMGHIKSLQVLLKRGLLDEVLKDGKR